MAKGNSRHITNMFYNPENKDRGYSASFSGEWPMGGQVKMFKREKMADGSPIPENHPKWRLVWTPDKPQQDDGYHADTDYAAPAPASVDHDDDPFG